MHEPRILLAVTAAVVVLIVILLIANQMGSSNSFIDRYGPPPGMARAIDPSELPYIYGDRGWAHFPRELEGSSASSMSQFMERSA